MTDSSLNRATRISTAAAASMLIWISRTLFGLLVSFPILLSVRGSGMTSGPDGDAVLFQPGSLLLLELLRIDAVGLTAAAQISLLLLGLAMVLELIPLALALDLLWLPGQRLVERSARAIRLFPRFLLVGAIALLLQAAVLFAASLLGAALKPVLASGDERLRSIAPIALFVLGLAACGAFGGVLDIARATLVQRGLGARAAFAHALLCLRERPLRVLSGLYPSVAGSALGVLGAAWLSTRFVSAAPPSAAIAIGFGAHQLAMLFAIGWRVRWLGEALELSAESD